ncbi:MAG: conjugal transfer protein TrbL family protein [Lachnospiraceae bacterium]
MEVILVLLIVAVLNGAVVYIDEMLQELIPMTLYADRYMLTQGGNVAGDQDSGIP